MDHSVVMVKGLAQLSEAMSHAVQGHPRWKGHSEEFWKNMVPWRRKWPPILGFLLGKPHEQYEKAKRYDTSRWTSQVWRCPVCCWGAGTISNSSRKKEVAGPKQTWWSAADESGGESKVRCCKEQYCIWTWNVRSMNQGKLDIAKREMVWANIDIIGISELK